MMRRFSFPPFATIAIGALSLLLLEWDSWILFLIVLIAYFGSTAIIFLRDRNRHLEIQRELLISLGYHPNRVRNLNEMGLFQLFCEALNHDATTNRCATRNHNSRNEDKTFYKNGL